MTDLNQAFSVPHVLVRLLLTYLLDLLQDRNESLFYRILLENFAEMASIVYDPTVGWACLNFHKLYRSPRGMYFSSEDAGQMVRTKIMEPVALLGTLSLC